MIPVTKPFLPPKEEYLSALDGIWERRWLTNNGPLISSLEKELKERLNVNNLSFVGNGTIALQVAIKALGLSGDIITTPFSYVATTSSIVWEGCRPVFVDIDEFSLNIDPSKIEEAITENTVAILATHVYGNPCDVLAIQQIADKYDLKVIYDAAHAFGVTINGESIFNYGDISTCSTHATKLFHTIEGGFIVTQNQDISDTVEYMRNFGHNGPESFKGIGINGKNSEFHAAMGIINLRYIDEISRQRKAICLTYNDRLEKLNIKRPKWHSESTSNYSYYPIIFENEELLVRCIERLKLNNIFGRRYFYPSLATSLPYVEPKNLSVTNTVSSRIFCLPLYNDLSLKEVHFICDIIEETIINEGK